MIPLKFGKYAILLVLCYSLLTWGCQTEDCKREVDRRINSRRFERNVLSRGNLDNNNNVLRVDLDEKRVSENVPQRSRARSVERRISQRNRFEERRMSERLETPETRISRNTIRRNTPEDRNNNRFASSRRTIENSRYESSRRQSENTRIENSRRFENIRRNANIPTLDSSRRQSEETTESRQQRRSISDESMQRLVQTRQNTRSNTLEDRSDSRSYENNRRNGNVPRKIITPNSSRRQETNERRHRENADSRSNSIRFGALERREHRRNTPESLERQSEKVQTRRHSNRFDAPERNIPEDRSKTKFVSSRRYIVVSQRNSNRIETPERRLNRNTIRNNERREQQRRTTQRSNSNEYTQRLAETRDDTRGKQRSSNVDRFNNARVVRASRENNERDNEAALRRFQPESSRRQSEATNLRRNRESSSVRIQEQSNLNIRNQRDSPRIQTSRARRSSKKLEFNNEQRRDTRTTNTVSRGRSVEERISLDVENVEKRHRINALEMPTKKAFEIVDLLKMVLLTVSVAQILSGMNSKKFKIPLIGAIVTAKEKVY